MMDDDRGQQLAYLEIANIIIESRNLFIGKIGIMFVRKLYLPTPTKCFFANQFHTSRFYFQLSHSIVSRRKLRNH